MLDRRERPPQPGLKVADTNCQSYTCAGDATQFCGGIGGYVLMWYDSTLYSPRAGDTAHQHVDHSQQQQQQQHIGH